MGLFYVIYLGDLRDVGITEIFQKAIDIRDRLAGVFDCSRPTVATVDYIYVIQH